MALAQLSPLYLQAIEDELRSVVGAGPQLLSEYYTMLEYHLGWTDGAGGGKRIRPLLCLLCSTAAGGDWEQALPMAAGIELLHNFTLIHDDIQDHSPMRRGRPTVWQAWGQAQAINAGDAMFTLAHLAPQGLVARGVAPETALAALAEFDRACLALTQGQYLDMAFEQRQRVAVRDYLTMIDRKTAALIAASTGLGAQLGGADQRRAAHFHDYGQSLGVAFQIQDDLLGIWGDPEVTGKSAASDLEKRKKSLPVVYGLERSERFAKAYAISDPLGASVVELTAALEALGARAYAEQQAREASQGAMQHLAEAHPHEPAATALRELTDQLLQRQM